MKSKSLAILILIILICMFCLTGCYSAEGLETLGYVVALGIDKGENNKIRLSLQFAILSNSSSGGGGSSSQSQESTVSSVDCASIESGISLINSYISKKVNLSHCKAIVISEELAYEGISEYVFTLINDIEVRPDCNIIISRCKASDYLENSKPTLESVSARYYEFTLNSSEYAGYTENITLADFYSDMLSTTTQAHAILGGINTDSTHKLNDSLPLYDLEGSYKADDTPIKSANVIENMGIAIFADDKLVGELSGMESLSHLLIVDKLESATISVPNPNLVQLFWYISVSIDENFDYSKEDNLDLVEDYINSYIEQNLSSYFYRTSKEFKSDVANLGIHVIKNYTTWDDWIESDWLQNYQNAFFTVNVDTIIIQSGQLFTKV